MKLAGFAFGSSAVLVSILAAGGCSNISDDCETTSTCDPLGGSSSGNAGKSGTSGNSSTGGTGAGEAGSSNGGKAGSGGSGSSGDAGAGAGGGGGGDCDVTASPATEPCLVSDDHAVFVSPDGSDDGAGTKDAPFASLTKAVEAAAGDKLVLVCRGSYDEHVNITAGARIFGGFSCTDWSGVAIPDRLSTDRPKFQGYSWPRA